MTDSKYTAMLIILDRSGSMEPVRKDMEGAVKSLLAEHAAQPGIATVDVVTFDTEIEHTHAFADPATVKVALEPRGATALHDAVAVSITGFAAAIDALPAHARPDTVLVSIVTDGEENSSREYSPAQVKQIIERRRREHDWDISFLGANQDAVFEAARIGIDAKDAIDFEMGSIDALMSAHTAKQLRRRAGDRTGYTSAERGAAKPDRH